MVTYIPDFGIRAYTECGNGVQLSQSDYCSADPIMKAAAVKPSGHRPEIGGAAAKQRFQSLLLPRVLHNPRLRATVPKSLVRDSWN
jgi:hypothetical protein